MRKLSNILLASAALALPFTLNACNSNDDGDGSGGEGGDNPSDGGKGNGAGGKGTGGNTGGKGSVGGQGTVGGQGGDLGGQGGDVSVGGTGTETGGSATGGSGPTIVPCEGESCVAAAETCWDEGGPGTALVESGRGAFSANTSWLEGWTNWDTESSGVGNTTPDEMLSDDIDADMTLTADKVWGIDGYVHVLDGATLTIEPGTVIKGAPGASVLIISRGGKIQAVGTKDAPIVFTSMDDDGDKAPGEWGGLVLLGRASNWQGGNVAIEGIGSPGESDQYGPGDTDGTTTTWDDESSGELKYVRIEFGGIELSAGKEINGLTLGSVGSGTKISYVEVNTTLDDCFEWFGGKVNANHIVCNGDGDDSFDVDQGWRGTIDTAFSRKLFNPSSDPNGLEWDSSLANKTPVTSAHIKHATLCGFGPDYGPVGSTNLSYGFLLREGVTGSIEDVFQNGFELVVDARDSFGTNEDPNMTIEGVVAVQTLGEAIILPETKIVPDDYADQGACVLAYDCDDDSSFDEEAWFDAGEGNQFLN